MSSVSELFNSKPLMVNKYVGVLPSRKNKHLETFVGQIPRSCTNIQDINDTFNPRETCVIGLFSWATPLDEKAGSNDAPPGMCIALSDLQSQHQMKLFIVGEASTNLPDIQQNSIFYIYGANSVTNAQDFETQSIDCPFVLQADDSNEELKIFILNRWLYSRLSTEAVAQTRERSPVSTKKPKDTPAPAPSMNTCTSGTTSYGYKYTQLSSLTSGSNFAGKANVCAVVKSFKPKVKTRGTDYCLSFYVVDPTYNTHATSVVVFHKMIESLPEIYRVGDIILMRRVTVQLHQNSLQLKGHFYSAFCVFDGREDRPLKPYSTSPNASLKDTDLQAVEKVKKWYFENKNLICYTEQCKLESVCPGLSFNFIGLVISVTPMEKEGAICLTVCDGTCIKIKANRAVLEGYPVHSDPELTKKYEDISVDIVVYNTTALNLGIQPGNFVYLHNLYAKTTQTDNVDGKMVFIVDISINRQEKEFISCSILPETDSDVLELKQALELFLLPHSPQSHQCSQATHSPHSQSSQCTRMSQSPPPLPSPSMIGVAPKEPLNSVTVHPHVSRPFTSIAEMTSPTATVPNKYRCIVRATAISISAVAEMVHLICPSCFASHPVAKTQEALAGARCVPGSPCDTCSTSSTPAPLLTYMYMFTMDVEDGTGTCKVLVCLDGADTLFGSPPANLYLDAEEERNVLEKLEIAFGRNPFSCNMALCLPSLDCCIMSYYSKGLPETNEEKQKARIIYRLFDTRLSSLPPGTELMA